MLKSRSDREMWIKGFHKKLVYYFKFNFVFLSPILLVLDVLNWKSEEVNSVNYLGCNGKSRVPTILVWAVEKNLSVAHASYPFSM